MRISMAQQKSAMRQRVEYFGSKHVIEYKQCFKLVVDVQ